LHLQGLHLSLNADDLSANWLGKKLVDTTGLEPVNLNNVNVALYQLSYASFFVKYSR
jgi:hypothetical protein